MSTQDKEEYYRQLYALQESSDEENAGVNEVKEFLEHTYTENSYSISSTSSPLPTPSKRRTTKSKPVAVTPITSLRHTSSTPASSIILVKETPIPLHRRTSLFRYGISTPEVVEQSPGIATQACAVLPDSARISVPSIGSLFMKNSTGIASMLGKGKRKRKDSLVKLVAEKELIFTGKLLFFIPPDDIAPIRRTRILKAQNYGASWAKQWTSEVTHIVVDKTLGYNHVVDFLKPLMKTNSIPLEIIVINEDYLLDCIQFRHLVDPYQSRYLVNGYEISVCPGDEVQPDMSQGLNRSLKIKGKGTGKWDVPVARKTPSQSNTSEEATSFITQITSSSPTAWVAPAQTHDLAEAKNFKAAMVVSIPSTPTRESDFLDEIIETTKGLKHLPLDDEEDEDRPSSSGNDPSDSGDSGEEQRASRKRNRNRKNGSLDQAGFSCMNGGTGETLDTNPNGQTIEILQEMADYYDRIKDEWRTRAYKKAIGVLKKQGEKITTYEQAANLPMVGDRLAKKIEEISLTSRLRRLESAKMEPHDLILQRFLKIYGVGPKQAYQWVQAGHQTIEDLIAHVKLTKNEKIGIEHYDDFNARIPRAEVHALGEFVKKAAAVIDPKVECIIGGSYRRGASTSGDIDIILTKPGTTMNQELHPFLNSLIDQLTKDNFLVAALAVTKREGGSKWHGACVLPETSPRIWRRIDFLIAPYSELGAALIYFTGDDIFNRSIRLLSSKKGMRLNQRGLYQDVICGPGRIKLNEGTLIEGADEKKIFEILGVPWRPPEQRICH